MNIVTTTAVFPEGYPQDAAVDRLAKIGFTHLDMALSYCAVEGSSFVGDAWRDWARSLRRQAEGLGVTFTHAHACSSQNPLILRCFEACEILGIRYLVIHPTHEREGKIITDDREFISHNTEIIRKLLSYAMRHNVIIKAYIEKRKFYAVKQKAKKVKIVLRHEAIRVLSLLKKKI